jgi:hypothetical protein
MVGHRELMGGPFPAAIYKETTIYFIKTLAYTLLVDNSDTIKEINKKKPLGTCRIGSLTQAQAWGLIVVATLV